MGRLVRSKVAIVGLAVLTCLVGVCSPRVRAFAAAKLSGIHSSAHGALKQSGPIPYILDLSKRKAHNTSNAKAPAKSALAKTSTKPSKQPAKGIQPAKTQQVPTAPAPPSR